MVPYVGEIRMFGGNFPPVGWAFCDGQILPISGNEALYTLLGTTYGGDGVTTFALPDYRGRIPVNNGVNPRTGTNYPLGQLGGTETVTLTTSNLPPHTHAVNVSSQEGTIDTPSGSFFAKNVQAYSTAAPTAQMASGTISATGGSQPHDNMMPYLPVSYIIALEGAFPSSY
ncbi:phage tail protein [Brevibacillus fluminis]|uniref:Phage tail protein n=1 Tax=Brevibacillus fluminis TaxID=511487 RepID=A0A3M8DPP3_9BACL|nr:tail fiber protein [Brevibacillus fluminis]RNB89479.1 phage tail protein [Brevibacillus fluminis]